MLGGKRHLKGRKQSNDVSASRKTWLPADVGDVDAFPSLFFVFSFFVSWSQQSLETIKKTGSKKKGRGESHSIQAISKEVRKVRRFGAQMKFLRMAIMTRCVFFFCFFAPLWDQRLPGNGGACGHRSRALGSQTRTNHGARCATGTCQDVPQCCGFVA